jgi:hypothetical protein
MSVPRAIIQQVSAMERRANRLVEWAELTGEKLPDRLPDAEDPEFEDPDRHS